MVDKFAPNLPSIAKFYAYGTALIAGIALAGSKGMKNVSLSEEELLQGYGLLVMFSVVILFVCYMVYQVDSGVESTANTTSLIFYLFGLMAPISMTADFLTYEMLDSRRSKRKMVLRLKRLGAKIWFAFMFSLAYLLVFKLTSFLTSGFYAMLFSGLIVSLGLFILSIQFGDFLRNLFSGEY